MNREEKRDLKRKLRQRRDPHSPENVKKALAAWKIAKNSVKTHSEPQEIYENDKVRIDVEKVKGRLNYINMNADYKKFVEENEDTIFTAHFEYNTGKVVSFIEEPKWMFWCGDLIKVCEESVDGNDTEQGELAQESAESENKEELQAVN